MAIGNSYPVRPILRAQDLFLGTQYGSNNTVNYTTGAIVDYLNTNASIAIGGQLTFKFLINEYESKSIFFPGGGGDNTSFSSITQLLISNADCSGNETNVLLEYLEGTDILISEQNHPNIFGHYKITSYTATVVPGFYTIDLEYIGGNGSIQEDVYYNINSFILASNSDIPTLQQVTDAGDATTTTVHLDGGALSDSVNEQASFSPSSISTVNKNTGSGVELGSIGYVGISPDGIYSGIFAAEYITGDITLQFPNKPTGTYFIATTEDVNTQGLPQGGTTGQILTKVDATDYNATWQDNYADWTSQVKHIVKNNGLSGTITKGTAVYVTGSNGTNMLVGRASNTSEATSSKTMGLMQSDITTTGSTQTGFVITEGLLGGLDTSGHIAGEPVWLGVNGTLIYGLANKPYAPAHLVFIGIVTKISAGNGEIFVKVQNGFELKEIHDVDLVTTTPINGDVLGYDGTLWVNKTIAGWLGFTPVTNARTISTTAPLSGGGDLSANRVLSISQATTSTNGYVSSTDWNTFNGKTKLTQLGSQTLTFTSWSLVGGFYTYTFSNVNITSTSVVDFTPNNASINEVSSCRMLPQVDVASGSCTFYATFPPQSNITGAINVWQ